jgi:hypothetical protein
VTSLFQIILATIALEWVVWFIISKFVPDTAQCPTCRKEFPWGKVPGIPGSHGAVKLTSFPCPICRQIIGHPSWRKSVLRIGYLGLLVGFLFLFFMIGPVDDPGGLAVGFIGPSLCSLGGLPIVERLIRRRLEPGSPSQFT